VQTYIPRPLPALRRGADGVAHVDLRAVLRLAIPLFLNSSLQAVLNLTDTWFIGRLSSQAMAGMGSIYWFVLVAILLLGGIGMAVQTLAAQAYGGGRYEQAARAAWSGAWGAGLSTPLFVIAALGGSWLIAPFHLDPQISQPAMQFWEPRMFGGPIAVALWGMNGFFNGIGRTRVTLLIMISIVVVNAVLNEVFIFRLDMGIAGSAWATMAAQATGLAVAIAVFISRPVNARFHSRRNWRPKFDSIRDLIRLGIPMGFTVAVDVSGLALFQAMQTSLGPVGGAATQIVMMLTSIAYLPTVGLALAGTTLVGQSIGAGDREWAMRVGNTSITLCIAYMSAMGLALGLSGPWLIPLFTAPTDALSLQVISLGITLLWIGAAYQVFDGLNLGAAFCLRGAADVRVPTYLLLCLSWCLFVPLAHVLTYRPGEGVVHFLPQFGLGAVGGWSALLVYVAALGTCLLLRWRSGAWKRIHL
jgi:MATE family multidrug resistance protein